MVVRSRSLTQVNRSGDGYELCNCVSTYVIRKYLSSLIKERLFLTHLVVVIQLTKGVQSDTPEYTQRINL